MCEFEFDLTPQTQMLKVPSSLGWKKSLAELIDNSFDAKATSVHIAYGGRTLVVEDDGIGCHEIDAFFRQGKHSSRNGVGRHGVGLKDAALWLRGTTEVRSMSKTGGVQCSINWKRFIEGGKWTAIAQRLPASESTGTRINFSGIIPTHLLDTHIEELGYLFYPAIESGRQILFRRNNKRYAPIPAFQFPPLSNVLEIESDVQGKPFRVRAGIVLDGYDNPHPGFTIAYKHRVITNTADGCGGYGTARFVGVVQLGEQWKLSRNKDELVEDAALLAETLHLLCRETLAEAAEKSRIVTLAGIETTIATNLREALRQGVKAQRDADGGKKGTVSPRNTNRTHGRAGKIQPGGKRLMAKIGNHIAVQFVPGLPQIGAAQFNEDGALISLSLRHPYVDWAKDHADTNALTALAATVLAIEAANILDEKQRHRLMPEIDGDDIRDRFLGGLSLYTSQMSEAAV